MWPQMLVLGVYGTIIPRRRAHCFPNPEASSCQPWVTSNWMGILETQQGAFVLLEQVLQSSLVVSTWSGYKHSHRGLRQTQLFWSCHRTKVLIRFLYFKLVHISLGLDLLVILYHTSALARCVGVGVGVGDGVGVGVGVGIGVGRPRAQIKVGFKLCRHQTSHMALW